VAFDFWFKHNYGFKIYYASLCSAIFLKEKIKTEKNKKESLLERAVQDGLSRFLSEKILPERWRFF
jgi:hypothetical protein